MYNNKLYKYRTKRIKYFCRR